MDNNKKTLNTYDEIANQYASLNNGNTQMKHFHQRFQTYLPSGFVYDIGCGTGRDVAALSEMGYETVGVDGSANMLKVASSEFPTCQFAHCNLLTDIHTLRKADGLWSCASLLHFSVEEFEQVFKELHQLLNQDGIMYLSLKIKDKMFHEEINGRFFQYYTKAFLDDFFHQYGMTILHNEETSNRDNCFANYFLKK